MHFSSFGKQANYSIGCKNKNNYKKYSEEQFVFLN